MRGSLRMVVRGMMVCGVMGGSSVAFGDGGVFDGMKYSRLEIKTVRDGELVYLERGVERRAEMGKVSAVDLSDPPEFDEAEAARGTGKAKEAARLYTEAMARMNDGDLRLVAEARAIGPLEDSGDFLTAVKYFWDLYRVSPTAGTLGLRPEKMPEASSKMLAEAAEFLKGKLADAALKTVEAQKALKGYLLEIYQQANDPRAAALAAELGGVSLSAPTAPTAGAAGGTPAAEDGVMATAPVIDDGTLRNIQTAMAAKNYGAALNGIEKALAAANGEMAIRLFMMEGEAYAGMGRPVNAAGAYLRIAAFYPNDAAAASEALYRAAGLLEGAKRGEEAKRLYREIEARYPQSEHAREAKQKAG